MDNELGFHLTIPTPEQTIQFKIDHRSVVFMISRFYQSLLGSELKVVREMDSKEKSDSTLSMMGCEPSPSRLPTKLVAVTMFSDFLEFIAQTLILWDWHGNTKFDIPDRFLSAAYDFAKKRAKLSRPSSVPIPTMFDFLSPGTPWLTRHRLMTSFKRLKAETTRLQKQMIDLGFVQPVLYELLGIFDFDLQTPSCSLISYCSEALSPSA